MGVEIAARAQHGRGALGSPRGLDRTGRFVSGDRRCRAIRLGTRLETSRSHSDQAHWRRNPVPAGLGARKAPRLEDDPEASLTNTPRRDECRVVASVGSKKQQVRATLQKAARRFVRIERKAWSRSANEARNARLSPERRCHGPSNPLCEVQSSTKICKNFEPHPSTGS
jgi:hypothetical protein